MVWRSSCLVLPILLASSACLMAQESRVTFAPRVGHVSTSPIFEYGRRLESPSGTPQGHYLERLRVRSATVFGAQAALRVAGRWMIYGDAAHGGTDYDYIDGVVDNDQLVDGREVWGSRAAITTVELGVERQIALPARGTYLGVAAGGAIQRYRVGDGRGDCVPGGASFGAISMICSRGRWERAYWVPGVVGGLKLGQELTGRLGIEIGARYSLGRADTENFGRLFIAEAEHLGPQSTYRVSATQLSAGVTLRL